VYRKTLLQNRERNGLIFIQAMMLWSHQDMLSGIAATESHQVALSPGGNSQKPCHMPRMS
jgi:hypothetical protein